MEEVGMRLCAFKNISETFSFIDYTRKMFSQKKLTERKAFF